MKNTDLTFFTNEPGHTLLDRFKSNLIATRFFDVLVGYFYTSGFYALYKSLENTEKIRILVGISTDKKTVEFIEKSRQVQIQFSHSEVKDIYLKRVENEIESSADSFEVEEGILKFQEWLRSEKLEIKAYPTSSLHAKLYIMTFKEGDRDVGRVITGSSNFTQSGLVDNLEFNVELKNRTDYEFSINKFNELWEQAVDVKDKYLETIPRTWLKLITPYNLYLKFLYEYFKDELNISEDITLKYFPKDFMKLEYQKEAVSNAKRVLLEYGGVFLSDVVGLGKTYMAAMLSGELDGRTLVIAPPVLLEKNNPGSWNNVFSDFRIPADFESLGKLDNLIRRGTEKYKNIIIDEVHRFRTESNITYEKLAQVCRGKRVILVTATPLNNTPSDILSQLKLFQKSKKSTIPGLPNLDIFFSTLEKRLKNLDRLKDRDKFIKISKENSILIREKILKFLMVRRTRTEIQKYFENDLKEQGLKFPDVANPQSLFYQLNNEEEKIFGDTIKLITKNFKYVRYTPLLPKYFSGIITQPEELAQKNMRKFMKILLVKRLESSFYAFNNSIDRFIISYEKFIKEFDKGNVYVSKKYSNKIFELIDNDDDLAIQRLIEEEKVTLFDAKEFKKVFKDDLIQDLNVLKEVKKIWSKVKRDPKIIKFIDVLKTDPILKNKKVIIFTESKETAEYLESKIQAHFPNQVLLYTGQSSSKIREKVTDNFDAKARLPKNDFRILVSTEVLSEGVNLHRSNVVINYDIPWNPTRLMQRVGRINRVDTKFNTIYSYNFFPTIQSNDEIKLTEAAVAKIAAFISLLGNDARLLTDGEVIESHELFNRLTSKKTITGEDEEEISILEYISEIKNIRDKNPDLFAKVKRLPKKARSSRCNSKESGSLLTYFRKGKLQKFFLADTKESTELDFFTAAELLRADIETKLTELSKEYYSLLDMNKKSFEFSTIEEPFIQKGKGGRDSTTQFLKILRAMNDYRQYTEEQEFYLRKVIKQTEEGGLPKQTIRVALKELKLEINNGIRPLKFLAVLQKNIPDELLKEHIAESSAKISGPREVILSEFFTGD